jgi:hypothetical protein
MGVLVASLLARRLLPTTTRTACYTGTGAPYTVDVYIAHVDVRTMLCVCAYSLVRTYVLVPERLPVASEETTSWYQW